ncbi:hypothetical protein MVEN_02364100 [Mycena venus]|uniref:Uncharacterized protein n=1 Tax=Mycena venus TaxID=2733690 RepID=A0A8H6X3B7_9AGAR|nr:hypothetical protein MVEN_02364100 [Mycena venus]
MAELSLSQGRLFGALYEAILYGINFILFVFLLYLFFQEKKTTFSQRLRLVALCFLFCLCTAHLALGMRGLYVAFFISDLPPDTFYLDHTQPLDLIGKGVYAAATVVADGLLIFRAYIIFSGRWQAVILPCMSLAATLGSWIALIHAYSRQARGTTLFPHHIAQLAVLSFAMSFITNVIITIMICVRIWLAMRRFKSTGISTSFYKQFLAFTVESGLIYPVVLIITGIFFALDNNGLEIVSGSNTQVLGIVPILLSLQLRFNLSAYDTTRSTRNVTVPVFNSDTDTHEGTELDGMARPPRKAIHLNPDSSQDTGTAG